MSEGADFRKYVAIGDSITAGYADAALYRDAQLCSFASLLAKQLHVAGCTRFTSGLLPADSCGIGFNGNSRLIIKRNDTTGVLTVDFFSSQGDAHLLMANVFPAEGGICNLGIPGAKLPALIMPGYGNSANGQGRFNPFFTRLASDPSASVLSDALAQDPTFFTLLAGNNDVLMFALSGGTSDAITPASDFEKSLTVILEQFASRKIKGAVANLPDILSIPFFTCLPYNSLLLTEHEAHELNDQYADASLVFLKGRNAFVAEDASSASGKRQLRDGDLLLYDVLLDPNREQFLRGKLPVPAKYVLGRENVLLVRNAIKEYNRIIFNAAKEFGHAFVDLHAFLLPAACDRRYNPLNQSLEFETTGIFSLDALHVNSLGQALLANEFIKSINSTYRCAVPKLNILCHRPVLRAMLHA